MGQKLSQVLMLVAAGLLLTACSNDRERPLEVCKEINGMCVLAPKKATSRPYQIKGVWYYPQPHFEYDEVGIASYYGGGDVFHGRPTATGEIFDMNEVTGAHKTLPLPCFAEVTNLENGRQINLKINDRGPFVEGRIIDVSRRTAQLLGFEGKGTAQVRVRTLIPESLSLNGLDPSTAISPPVMLAQETIVPMEVAPSEVTSVNAIAEVPRLPDTLFEEQEAVPRLASADSPPVAPSTGIFVQVGGYQSHEDAYAISKSLEGFTNSPSQPVKNNGPKPYAVRLGPLPSMLHANQVLDQLVDAGHVMSRIVIHH